MCCIAKGITFVKNVDCMLWASLMQSCLERRNQNQNEYLQGDRPRDSQENMSFDFMSFLKVSLMMLSFLFVPWHNPEMWFKVLNVQQFTQLLLFKWTPEPLPR